MVDLFLFFHDHFQKTKSVYICENHWGDLIKSSRSSNAWKIV